MKFSAHHPVECFLIFWILYACRSHRRHPSIILTYCSHPLGCFLFLHPTIKHQVLLILPAFHLLKVSLPLYSHCFCSAQAHSTSPLKNAIASCPISSLQSWPQSGQTEVTENQFWACQTLTFSSSMSPYGLPSSLSDLDKHEVFLGPDLPSSLPMKAPDQRF